MRFAALVVGVLMASCQNATQPSPTPSAPPPPSPAPGPDVLVIMPTLSGMKLGATATLTAVVLSGSASGGPVAALWSSDAPDVVTIKPDGQIYGAQLGRSMIRAGYETLTASLALRVVPHYASNWSGWYRVTGCTRLSGEGPSVCRFLVGGRLGLRTTLTQDGATLSGTVDLFDNTGRVIVETGRVDGEIDAVDSLVLSGTTLTTDPSEPSRSTLSEWSSALTADGGGMVGRFIQTQDFQNFWGRQVMKYTCELEGFQRSNP